VACTEGLVEGAQATLAVNTSGAHLFDKAGTTLR